MTDVAAYDLYRRGSDRTRLRSDSAAREGVELLRHAVTLDSTYAAARAGLAVMHHRAGLELPPTSRERHHLLAVDAARRAVTLDDSLAEAHAVMSMIDMVTFDLGAAERHLTRAVAVDSTYVEPHERIVTLYLWMGRPSDALAHAERPVALDPLWPGAHAEVARALLGHDRCDEALTKLDELAQLRPALRRVADIAAQCYARKRLWTAAVAALRPQAARGMPTSRAPMAYMLGRAGRRGKARRIHSQLLEHWRGRGGGAFEVGLAAAGLGDLDRAIAWFERSVADRSLHAAPASPGHLMLVLPGPLSDDLRHHGRFARLRARLGLPAP